MAKENNRVTKPLYVGFRNVTGYTLSLGAATLRLTTCLIAFLEALASHRIPRRHLFDMWLRIEVGYDNSWARCCYCMCLGGSSMEPRSATSKQKALAYIDAGSGMATAALYIRSVVHNI